MLKLYELKIEIIKEFTIFLNFSFFFQSPLLHLFFEGAACAACAASLIIFLEEEVEALMACIIELGLD